MTQDVAARDLTRAVQRYFDLCYDSDVSRFNQVFRRTAQLHGLRNGELTMMPADAFRDAVAGRPSLKSRGVAREEQILLMDVASDSQAFVKVRVRWNAAVYIDYLTYHRSGDEWLITSKGFHIEETEP
jgi:Putative lumazine-binding